MNSFKNKQSIIDLFKFARMPDEIFTSDEFHNYDFDTFVSYMAWLAYDPDYYMDLLRLEDGIENGKISPKDAKILRTEHPDFFRGNEYPKIKEKYKKLKFKKPDAICDAFNKSADGDYSFVKNPLLFFVFAEYIDIDDKKLAEFSKNISVDDIAILCKIPEFKECRARRVIKTHKSYDELKQIDKKHADGMTLRRARDQQLWDADKLRVQEFSEKSKRYSESKNFKLDHVAILDMVKDTSNRTDRMRAIAVEYTKLMKKYSNNEFDFARTKITSAMQKLQKQWDKHQLNQNNLVRNPIDFSDPLAENVYKYENYFLSLDITARKEFVQIIQYLNQNGFLSNPNDIYRIYNNHFKNDKMLCDMITGNNGSFVINHAEILFYDSDGYASGTVANWVEFGYSAEKSNGRPVTHLVYDNRCVQSKYVYNRQRNKFVKNHIDSSLPQPAEIYYKYLQTRIRG